MDLLHLHSRRPRDTEKQHTSTDTTETDYAYGSPTGQPHTLASATAGTATKTYTYDKTGNTLTRPGAQATQTLTWDSEGKLAATSEPSAAGKPAKSTTYLHDADGELLIRRTPSGDGDTILYLGSTEVRLALKGGTKTLSGTRYYTANGQRIAVRTATSGTSVTQLQFLVADHHGTSSVALDASTYAVTKRYTSPFGANRGTPPANNGRTTRGSWGRLRTAARASYILVPGHMTSLLGNSSVSTLF
ncbi:hypothetical protein ACFQ60_00235 [Streptomyces zhihengii]